MKKPFTRKTGKDIAGFDPQGRRLKRRYLCAATVFALLVMEEFVIEY